jgi:hypothetical protein
MAVGFLHLATKSNPHKKRYTCHEKPGRTILRVTHKGGILDAPPPTTDVRYGVSVGDVIHAANFTLSKAPSASIAGKCNISSNRDVSASPGPQAYVEPGILANSTHPLYHVVPSTKFSTADRMHEPCECTPSASEYGPVKLNLFRHAEPTYVMGMKRPTRGSWLSPRPGCENFRIRELSRDGRVWDGPSWSLKGRWRGELPTEGVGLTRKEEVSLEPSESRRKFDTGGRKRCSKPPTWSFSKARRFARP